MQKLVVDVTGREADDFRGEWTCGSLNLISLSSLQRLRIVEIDKALIFKHIRESIPVRTAVIPGALTFKTVSIDEYPRLFDQKIIMVRTKYLQVDNSRAAIIPYMVTTLKPEIRDILSGSKYKDRFHPVYMNRLIYFLSCIDILHRQCNKLISRIGDDSISLKNGSRNISQILFGNGFTSILPQVKGDLNKERITTLLKNKFLETSITERDLSEMISAGQQCYGIDQLTEYKSATVPMEQLESDFLNMGRRIFANTYTHPSMIARVFEGKTKNGIILSSQTYDFMIKHVDPKFRMPIINKLFQSADHRYYWSGTMKDMITEIDDMLDISIDVIPITKTFKDINLIFDKNGPKTGHHFEISSYVSTSYIVEMVAVAYKTWINPNLYIVYFDHLIDCVSHSIADLINTTITMRLLPPNVVPIHMRYQINNSFCRFLIRHVAPIPRFPAIQALFPADLESSEWDNAETDYLSIYFSECLPAIAVPVRDEIQNFCDLYFQGNRNYLRKITIDEDGVSKQIPISICCPWFVGAADYNYPTHVEATFFRNNVTELDGGICIPSMVDEEYKSSVPLFRHSLSVVSSLISLIPNNVTPSMYPEGYPTRDVVKGLVSYLRDVGCKQTNQIVSSYYDNIYKFAMSLSTDSVVRPNVPMISKQAILWRKEKAISLVALLSNRNKLPNVNKSLPISGLPIAVKAQMFLMLYNEITI